MSIIPIVVQGPTEDQLAEAKKNLASSLRERLEFALVKDGVLAVAVVTAFQLSQDILGDWTIRGTIEDPLRARIPVVVYFDPVASEGVFDYVEI